MAAHCRFYISDDFGQPPKDAVVAHLRAHPTVVDKYYSAAAAAARHVASDPTIEARGVIVCGTGTGVAIFTNKYPGVYATHCASPSDAVNTRSINTCNFLALSGIATPPAAAISDAWFSTPIPLSMPCLRRRPLAGGHPALVRLRPRRDGRHPRGLRSCPRLRLRHLLPEKGDGVRAENKRFLLHWLILLAGCYVI